MFFVCFCVVFTTLNFNNLYAKSANAGTKAAEFLTFGVGARALAMAGAYTAADNDLYSVFWNPAGLATLENSRIAFMHNSLPADITHNYFSIGWPLKPNISKTQDNNSYIAFTLNYGKYGKETITTYTNKTGTGLGSFDGSDILAKLSYANKFNRQTSAGVNAKIFKQKLYDYSATALALDAGVIYKYNDDINFGAGIYNLGNKIKFVSEKEELPLQLKTGISAKLLSMLTAYSDLIYTKDEDLDLAVGAEIRILKQLAFRTGINTINEAGNGFTLGFGINFNNRLNLDYAYEPYGDFENAHKLSIDYAFGVLKKPKDSNLLDIVLDKKEEIPQVSVETLIKEGYLYTLDAKYFFAMFKFYEAVQREPMNIQARLWLAYSYTKLGNIKYAIQEYENVLRIDPYNQNAAAALKILRK